MYSELIHALNGKAQLVAVSKTQPADRIMQLYALGQRDFGENKVQEWEKKVDHLPSDIRWHLIGSLQTNKVKYVVGKVHLIHSVDRMKLLKEINKESAKAGIVSRILIQCKIAREETKAGADESSMEQMISAAERGMFPNVEIKGLMGMASFTENEEVVRHEFRQLRAHFERLKFRLGKEDFDTLSMGMSGDYRIAIEEGSTMVRIGSLLFGERK